MDLFLVGEFRRLTDGQVDELVFPERPERRKTTNKKWLNILIGTIVVLIPFVIYTLVNSDIRRFTHGSDSCGNICGYENPKIEGINCTGVNYTSEPYTEVEFSGDIIGKCVSDCPGSYTKFYYQCIKNQGGDPRRTRLIDILLDPLEDLNGAELSPESEAANLRHSWWNLIVSSLIAIGIAVFGLFLFRFATALLVWSILVFSTIIVILLAVAAWMGYVVESDSSRDGNAQGVMVIAIFLTIAALGIVILLAVLFKKIKLVILLYKETSKAVFAMPLMILIPVVTVLVEMIVLALLVVFMVWAYTAGVFTQIPHEQVYVYSMNFAIEFSMVYAAIITIWVLQFIVGIQDMVIAGSVSSWYFSKNQPYADSPISTSFKNTTTFHLGTVALGSLILTLMAIVKGLIRVLAKNKLTRALLECCLGNVEEFLKLLSKNAYIETALHGQPFFRSGKRAAKLLLANAASLIAVNCVGDFVLGMAKLILVVVATFISALVCAGNNYCCFLVAICFFLNVIIIKGTFAVFETTVDSLFICFCEDKVINDGLSRPYAMSRDLIDFVENAKKVYQK